MLQVLGPDYGIFSNLLLRVCVLTGQQCSNELKTLLFENIPTPMSFVLANTQTLENAQIWFP